MSGAWGPWWNTSAELARARNKATGAGERFRHRATNNIDLIIELKVIDGAAALAAQNAETMSVVDHEKRTGLIAGAGDFRQATDVPFHGIDAFHDDHFYRLRFKRL